MLVEHSFEGVNHSSSRNFVSPFSDSFKIALEKSLAIGEPFGNTYVGGSIRFLLDSLVVEACSKNIIKTGKKMKVIR